MESPVETTDKWQASHLPRWVLMCEWRPIRYAQSLPQLLQGKESEVELCFLLSFFDWMATFLLFSKSLKPCVHCCLQRALSWAVVSQEVAEKLQFLRFAFKVSLYLLRGLPWSRCPCFNSLWNRWSLWNPIIFHAYNMSCPSRLALDDQALNAGEVALF